MLAQMGCAPACRAAFTASASWSGPSEIRAGSARNATLVRIPASTSRRTISSRRRGGAVPGSVVRQTRSSSVGTETLTETSARRAASWSTSTSRQTSGPRVISENGVRRRESSTRQARVRR